MAEDEHKVSLNVYDLSQGMARQLSMTLLGKAIEGIWHTGVVVYGKEYYFSGGIQGDAIGSTPYGTPIKVVDLGVTHLPKDVFDAYLEEISPRYTSETYSLLKHNCNNFSNEVSQFLVGVSIPEYILQLPNEVMGSPMGALMLPMMQQLESTLRAGAVPQPPQFKAVPATVKEQSTTNTEEGNVSSGLKEEVDCCLQTEASAVDNNNARSRVHEEISKEFAAIMATGSMRASEAAALAARRVMQKYGIPQQS